MKRLIIAEIGHNHNGDMEIAKRLIGLAKETGADIAKFQLYETDRIVTKEHRAYDDLKRGELNRTQWEEIIKTCNETGIEYCASVFDAGRVEWCREMMRFKVASRSIYDVELLDAIIKTGKDIIISLGKVDKRGIPKPLVPAEFHYLYCVAKYPAPMEELRLRSVDWKYYSGFSDHSEGIAAAIYALARGARIIEKHFTLDRNMDGCDQKASIEADELKELVRFARICEGQE